MHACVDLVWLVLGSVDRKESKSLEEEVLLLRYELRSNGVVRVPAVRLLEASRPSNTVPTYETLRMPVNVMRMLLTDMDSGLVSTSLPVSSASCASDDSP
jgi:hypothetical protein